MQPPGSASSGMFGASVAVSGDTAVVGAPFASSGKVYVYTRGSAAWEPQDTLDPPASAPDGFGSKVDIFGDWAVVQCGFYTGVTPAFVYHRVNGAWAQDAVLTPTPVSSGQWSGSLAMADGLVAFGAPDFNGSGEDRVYLFAQMGGSWDQTEVITPPQAAVPGLFGWALDTDGKSLLVSAPFAQQAGGLVVPYRFSLGEWQVGMPVEAPTGTAAEAQFGTSVSVFGDDALVGASGSIMGESNVAGRAFLLHRSGNNWEVTDSLSSTSGAVNDQFGASVALGSDIAVVGAPNDGAQGAAYLFERNTQGWSLILRLAVADTVTDANYGRSVDLSGTALAVGQPDGEGHAWMYFVGDLPIGNPCSGADDCANGICVDGVCCDSPCEGGDPSDCVACSVQLGSSADGTCMGLTGTACNGGVCASGVCTASDGGTGGVGGSGGVGGAGGTGGTGGGEGGTGGVGGAGGSGAAGGSSGSAGEGGSGGTGGAGGTGTGGGTSGSGGSGGSSSPGGAPGSGVSADSADVSGFYACSLGAGRRAPPIRWIAVLVGAALAIYGRRYCHVRSRR